MNPVKKCVLTACVLLLALVLASCGSAAEKLEPGTPVPDEPYEAVDYNLYPAPADGFVGDVMPFVTDNGTLELYYLFDSNMHEQAYHPIYKLSTKDLSGYTDHGMMLNYGSMFDPDPALGTGSVIQDPDGLYHLFYTGHNDTGVGGMGKECVMHAVSTDREHWEKIEGVVFYRPEGYSGDDFRDPEVFWVEQDQCYWLLIAAREDDLGGVVLKYTSTDLEHWELYGPIFAPMQQYMLECPDLFRMGDKWYLTYSWDSVSYYAMSDSIDGPFVAPRNNTLDGKGTMEGKGFIFYGGKTAEWHGNTYLCGWLGRAGLYTDSGAYDWAGSVMVHQLIQNPDGTLAVKAPDDLADYFNLDKIVISSALEGDVSIDRNNIALNAAEGEYALADLGTRPATMTLECDVTFDEDGRAGFAFGDPNAEEPYYTALCLDASWNMIHYEGYELSTIADLEPVAGTKFDFTEPGTHLVKLVCENEILVLYIDNLRALSLRVRNSTDGAHLCVFSYGCSASFNNILMKIPG